MGSQGPGRKRTPNRNGLTAEEDALNIIAREAETRLAAKRAARAEAREIRMRELERQQKEKYYGLDNLDNKWGDIEQWMEDNERYTRHSQRRGSMSDDEEQTSFGSRGNLQSSECSGFFSSCSRTPSKVSSRCQSPVLDDQLQGVFLEKGSFRPSALTTATLTSLGETSSCIGSGDSSATADTEVSKRELKEIHDLKDQIQDVETKYVQSLKEAKDSLAEMEDKYRKAMVSNAQFDNEKSNLMYQVDNLKDSLIELEELLAESRREFEEKSKDLERERQAYSVLQFQFSELKETLKKSDELLTEMRQLRLTQDGFVREISDLQETIEWKNKKIGALEKQKEYSDSIRNERDELRDEVVQLRDILKKHGIVLGPDLSTDKEVGDDVTDESSCTQIQERSSVLGTQEMQLSRDENIEGNRRGQDQQPKDLDHGMQKNNPPHTHCIYSEPNVTTQSDNVCIGNGLNKDLNQILHNIEQSQNVFEAQICTLSFSEEIKVEKEGDSKSKAGVLEPILFTEGPMMTNQYASPVSTENSEIRKAENPGFTSNLFAAPLGSLVYPDNQLVVQDKKAVPSAKIDKISEQSQTAGIPSRKKKKKRKNKQKHKKTTYEKECDTLSVVVDSFRNMNNSLEVENAEVMTQMESDLVELETNDQISLDKKKTIKAVNNEMTTQDGQIVPIGPENIQHDGNVTVGNKYVMAHSENVCGNALELNYNSAKTFSDNILRERPFQALMEVIHPGKNQECHESIDDALESKVVADEVECGESFHCTDLEAMSDINPKCLSVGENENVICSKGNLQEITKSQQGHMSYVTCAVGQQQTCKNRELQTLTDAQDTDQNLQMNKQDNVSSEGEQEVSIKKEGCLTQLIVKEEHCGHEQEDIPENDDQIF
ncbi:uncharacterized protein lrrfip1a isoform X3 [Salminus brasiliensis]|uniref:uncharacterized protein lrrfip1a isoform X3 n=1 Tax=Salminus brasiliensis TaxID=930266 RepID=UPI003B8388A8